MCHQRPPLLPASAYLISPVGARAVGIPPSRRLRLAWRCAAEATASSARVFEADDYPLLLDDGAIALVAPHRSIRCRLYSSPAIVHGLAVGRLGFGNRLQVICLAPREGLLTGC